MRPALIAASLAACLASACSPIGREVAGGPCSYDEMDFKAKPAGFTENTVQFVDPAGEAFTIQKNKFKVAPEPGVDVTIHKMTIISGACTPLMYTPVE